METNNNYQLAHQFKEQSKAGSLKTSQESQAQQSYKETQAENELLDCMNRLFEINSLLLDALKNNKHSVFDELITKRLDYSQKFEELGRSLKAPIAENLQKISMNVLAQDQELMIYLERRVQKLRGDYQKLNLFGPAK